MCRRTGHQGSRSMQRALLAAALAAVLLAVPPATAQTAAAAKAAPAKAAAAPKAGPKAASPPAAPKAAAAPAAAGKTFTIGCLVPLTGGKANTGKAVQAAIQMAIADIAPQRLPGVDVKLVCEDSKCADVPALRAAQKLAQQGADALIGDVCSAASLAATGVANKFQLPMVSPASTSMSLSGASDYFFRTVPSDRYQGQYAASRMLALGLKKVVVAYSDESYGQGLSFSFIAAFTKDGGKAYPVPMAVTAPPKNATATVLAEIKQQRADGLFIASNKVAQGANLIKDVKSAKLPFKVTIFNGDSMMDPTVPTIAGKANTLGIRGSDVSYGAPSFVDGFKKFTAGKNISYVAKASHAYDAAEALLEAYRRAQDPKEGPQIAAELANVRFQGKSGPVAFDEYGDLKYDPVTSYDTSEFDKDGNVVRVSS